MIQVFWHALVFGLAPVLRKLVGLVLLPLYTHYLSAADYGEIALLTMLTGLFKLVLRLELRAGFIRAHVEAADESARAKLLAAAVRLLGALGVAGALVFAVACEPLCRLLLGRSLGFGYVAVLAFGILVDIPALAFAAELQAQLRSVLMVSLGVLQFAVGATVTVLCIAVFRMGPIGFFIGGVSAATLWLLAMAWPYRRVLWEAEPAWHAVLSVVQYSLPLLVAALLFFVVSNADQFVVSQLLSVTDLGIYAMAGTIAGLLLSMVFTPIQASLDVWRFKVHGQQNGGAGLADIFRVTMALMGIAAVGMNTFGADVFILAADKRFAEAVVYLPLLSAAVLLQAGYTIIASAFFVSGKTGQWTRIFAAGALMQVLASLALVPVLGIAGAALGILSSNLLLYIGAASFGRAHWQVPYAHAPVAGVVIVSSAISYGRTLLAPLGVAGVIMADLTAVCLITALLLPLNLVRRSDLMALAALLRARLARLHPAA